ncbi:hypothetical protein ACWEKR_34285 [Nocardia sp. NPDC004573]
MLITGCGRTGRDEQPRYRAREIPQQEPIGDAAADQMIVPWHLHRHRTTRLHRMHAAAR